MVTCSLIDSISHSKHGKFVFILDPSVKTCGANAHVKLIGTPCAIRLIPHAPNALECFDPKISFLQSSCEEIPSLRLLRNLYITLIKSSEPRHEYGKP